MCVVVNLNYKQSLKIRQYKMGKKKVKYKVKVPRSAEQKIQELLVKQLIPTWPRDQALHDLAYSIIEKKIHNTFPEEEYEIIDVPEKVCYDLPDELNDNDFLPPIIHLIRDVLQWSPKGPPEKWTPLQKEMKYICQCKERALMAIIGELVFPKKKKGDTTIQVIESSSKDHVHKNVGLYPF